ncbi:MAG: hypothetical protein KDA22_00055 [Phycisphaerales bacterium]|nr:hypothetical protein [Phycisphaerales bacterium]
MSIWRIGTAIMFAASIAGVSHAQPAPMSARIGGVLVGDLTLDTIYLTRDLNGDGDVSDPGETTVFFDDTNASGLAGSTGNIFAIFQSVDRSVYFADGGSDTVYRLRDLNNDRDAQDAGEAAVWFSAANAEGFGLPTPNGIWQGADGAVYILNAGTGSNPSDAIYRTQDLNADGDADDLGEATVWFDLQTLVTDSSAFDLVFIGDVAYFSDTVGPLPDAVYRAEDLDRSGTIDAGEFNVFADESSPFGLQIGTGLVTDGTSLFIGESLASADQPLYRLTDLDGSGAIDDAGEVATVWTESQVPAGFELGSSFGLAIGPDARLALGSAGATTADNVFLLQDLNADGDYLDDGETTVWANGGAGSGDFVDNPRALEFALPKVGDLNGDDLVDGADLGLLLAAWGSSDVLADLNGDGTVDGADLGVLLANWD